MKRLLLAFLVFSMIQGCSPAEQTLPTETPPVQVPPKTEQPTPPMPQQPAPKPRPNNPTQPPKVYANEIFQDVTVIKTKENTYQVKGKARVFEAVMNYVVEDGHQEITQGFIQTSAGAPAWGSFELTLTVNKKEPNSTLHLVLFESSPNDGSRRLELPIPLP